MLTVLKSEVPHEWPEVTSYQNYADFDKHEFEKEIKNTIWDRGFHHRILKLS